MQEKPATEPVKNPLLADGSVTPFPIPKTDKVKAAGGVVIRIMNPLPSGGFTLV